MSSFCHIASLIKLISKKAKSRVRVLYKVGPSLRKGCLGKNGQTAKFVNCKKTFLRKYLPRLNKKVNLFLTFL